MKITAQCSELSARAYSHPGDKNISLHAQPAYSNRHAPDNARGPKDQSWDFGALLQFWGK